MSKFSTRLTIVGACIAVTASLMASMTGAAAAAIPGITVNDAKKTMTLTANITTDATILVPDGYTLDGKGFTITAVDVDAGTAFNGTAVVQNAGPTMNVKNLKIEGGEPNNCVATFNGVAFMSAGGSIKNVTLNNIGQTTGCQSGRAIVAWNTDASAPRRSVAIEGNTVWNYNKNGIDVRGAVDATILGNTVTGSGPVDYIAQNGIVVYGAATVAQVGGNKVSGNDYTGPAETYATGILVIDALVSIDRKNMLSGNEKDIDNAGTITGKFSPRP